MLAHPLARQQNNSCHTHSHKHAERARERGLKKVKERVGESGGEWERGGDWTCVPLRFCLRIFRSIWGWELEVVVAFVYGTQLRDDSNGRIIRSTREYNRGIPITRGVRGAGTHTDTHMSWGSDIIINCI